MTQTGLSFRILVIVIYLLFVICYLRFGIFLRNQEVSLTIRLPLLKPAAGLNLEPISLGGSLYDHTMGLD
jgi:hypothetical protein